ncbi:MAG TPA: hypothetical protein VK557_14225 [Pyrinomonadaceae bacterium]|nr:hypothetical protein [Pyrinomonadaceae bacterium]
MISSAPTAFGSPCDVLKAKPDVWIGGQVNALVLAAHAWFERDSAERAYDVVIDRIAGTVRKCALAEDKTLRDRYPEFLDLVTTLALARRPDHELGFTVTDETYFAETRQYVEIPAFLLTPAFLRTVTRYETLSQAKAMLRQMNANRSAADQLIFFSYESRHLGTPDNPNSFRRLLIVVPGHADQGIPEKWVQFGLTDPGARVRTRNVSVVSTVPGPGSTTNVYFKDYFRTYDRTGAITIKGRWELGEGDDNCASCHKSGILPIFPVAGSVMREELPLVEKVNERFLNYARPRFDKYLDATKLGPGLGSNALPLSPKQSVKCAECHHPNNLGSLNWPMDRTIISSYIKGGQMPYGFELTSIERARLYRRLVQDYFAIDDAKPGILKSWLLGKNRSPAKL